VFRKDASEKEIVRSGKIFGWMIAIAAMLLAPQLAPSPVVNPDDAGKGIFDYLQKMNGMYFIPIFAVVVVGMLTKRVPAIAAKLGLVVGFATIAVGYFVSPFDRIVNSLNNFHFLGIVFSWLLVMMLAIGEIWPRATEFVQEDVGAVDMTPWRFARPAGLALLAIVLTIYVVFADFSVLPAPN